MMNRIAFLGVFVALATTGLDAFAKTPSPSPKWEFIHFSELTDEPMRGCQEYTSRTVLYSDARIIKLPTCRKSSIARLSARKFNEIVRAANTALDSAKNAKIVCSDLATA